MGWGDWQADGDADLLLVVSVDLQEEEEKLEGQAVLKSVDGLGGGQTNMLLQVVSTERGDATDALCRYNFTACGFVSEAGDNGAGEWPSKDFGGQLIVSLSGVCDAGLHVDGAVGCREVRGWQQKLVVVLPMMSGGPRLGIG